MEGQSWVFRGWDLSDVRPGAAGEGAEVWPVAVSCFQKSLQREVLSCDMERGAGSGFAPLPLTRGLQEAPREVEWKGQSILVQKNGSHAQVFRDTLFP